MLKFALLFLVLVVGLNSECPAIDDLPAITKDGKQFYCAFNWWPKGDDLPIDACNKMNGEAHNKTWMENQDQDPAEHFYQPVGSLIVKAGCTFYGYSDYHYKGDVMQYAGPGVFPNGCLAEKKCPPNYRGQPSPPYFAAGFKSVKCRCEQDPITCEPSASWQTIMTCDNLQSTAKTSCDYKKTIGTTFTKENEHTFKLGFTVEANMKQSMFGLFSKKIGLSAETGYDFRHLSSVAKSETTTVSVSVTVPAGVYLTIQNVEGQCGGNTIKTQKFRMITHKSTSNGLRSDQRDDENGSEVEGNGDVIEDEEAYIKRMKKLYPGEHEGPIDDQ